MRYLLFIVFFSTCVCSYAQKNRKILDRKTGLPVSYVTIKIVNSTKGTIGAVDGSFLLSIELDDSVSFSSAGYEKTILSGKEIHDIIYMSARIVELRPVTIGKKIPNRTIMIGNERKINKGDIVWGPSIAENYDEFAQKIILPDLGTHLQIKKIFIPFKKLGKCLGPLLLRIYYSDSLKDQPGLELFSQVVNETNAIIKKNILVVDISSNNLFFNGTDSFFVSIAWPPESFPLKCKTGIPMSKLSNSKTYTRTFASNSFHWIAFGRIKDSNETELEIKTFLSIEADIYK